MLFWQCHPSWPYRIVQQITINANAVKPTNYGDADSLSIALFACLKSLYFQPGFGAEDEGMLSPFKDDKPKEGENTDFKVV